MSRPSPAWAALGLLLSPNLMAENIDLKLHQGVFHVPVEVNQSLKLDFIIDTGAADVVLPADVVSVLLRSGSLSEDDFLENQTYLLADGKKIESPQIFLKSLRIGSRTLRHVVASVGEVQSPMLLGQSLLRRLGPYTLDSEREQLLFEDELPRGQLSAQTLELPAAWTAQKKPIQTLATFFQSVAERRYDLSWESLSRYSQDYIVQKVSQEETLKPEAVREMFRRNDPSLRSGFWQNYRLRSKIPYLLSEASFEETGKERNNSVIKVKVGEQSLDFQILREDGAWKLGLIESLESP